MALYPRRGRLLHAEVQVGHKLKLRLNVEEYRRVVRTPGEGGPAQAKVDLKAERRAGLLPPEGFHYVEGAYLVRAEEGRVLNHNEDGVQLSVGVEIDQREQI